MRWLVVALGALAGAGCPGSDAAPRGQGRDTYDVGARPRAVAVADLNGDGRPDVVVANSGDGTVTILLGAGMGRLRRLAPDLPAGDEPSDVEAVDLDRDGDADLVVANHETPRITVLLNDGRASFRPAPGSPFDAGARPHLHGLATGDFDGDGWVDVAVESADTREIRVFRGGRGGLGAPVAVPVGTMPYYRLGAADVTGDGVPEVLVPGHGDNTVRFVQRTGGGLALAPRKVDLADKPWMVVGADLSGDDRSDLVVVHTDAIGIWLATGGGFVPAPGSPYAVAGATEAAAGDLDGDGIAEVAIGPWEGDEVTIVAAGKGATGRARACPRPIGLAIADLDGDGRGEIIAACATGSSVVVLRPPAAPAPGVRP